MPIVTHSTHAAPTLTDVLQWDVKAWSRALRLWDRAVDWSKVENCLEIGGREGGLSLWLAGKGKSVVCSDLQNTRATAEPLHARYGLTNRITYQDIDATQIEYENHFDIITFKSVLGGIGYFGRKDRQEAAMAGMYRALRPGGKLLFAENLVASPLHRLARRAFVPWAGRWRYVTRQEMREMTADYKTVDIRATGVLSAFGRGEASRSALAAIDGALLNYLAPPAWRYIVYGVATK